MLPSLDVLALILGAVAFGCFTQSLTGFGVGLVAMPILIGALGIRTAAPLMSLVNISNALAILLYYREALRPAAVWRLALAALVGIPVGVLALWRLDEGMLNGVLGLVVIGYAIYALLTPRLPQLDHPAWAYGLGLCSGLLAGAYNAGGPPLVIYASGQDWEPEEFKGNLQSVAILNNAVVVLTHALSGSYTRPILSTYLVALPAVALGVLAGVGLDRVIKPGVFRLMVLGLLIVLGARLILAALKPG